MQTNPYITQPRVVATVAGAKCPLGCIYCFVNTPNYKGLPELSASDCSIVERVAIVQPSADIEFLLAKGWQGILDNCVSMGKSISFATKLDVTMGQIDYLRIANQALKKRGQILNVTVSFTVMDERFEELEPNVPSPERRLSTLKRLHEAGIFTLVAIRPLMPFLTPSELAEMVEQTWEFCHGYLSGPLYLTPRMSDYLSKFDQKWPEISRVVNWMPGHPTLSAIESSALEDCLAHSAGKKNKKLFSDNIQAVNFLKSLLTTTE